MCGNYDNILLLFGGLEGCFVLFFFLSSLTP
jgi:hypothetical protein